jgi:hypothetical protein
MGREKVSSMRCTVVMIELKTGKQMKLKAQSDWPSAV